jgi:hypothetical protein
MVRCHKSKKGFQLYEVPSPYADLATATLAADAAQVEKSLESFNKLPEIFWGTVVFNCCSTRRVGWRAT